jgi:hypothetical protein
MFQFRDKTVFIITRENWGQMKISKHHYALELAKNNCKVFFIASPQLINGGIQVKKCEEHPNIKTVVYKPLTKWKHFFYSASDALPKYQVEFLIKKIKVKPDVVWSFLGYLFENLQWFDAPLNIFFAADSLSETGLPNEMDNATVSFAISDTIYEHMKESGGPVFQIRHGLQNRFVESAQLLLHNGIETSPKNNITVGYSGNLRMQPLDRPMMMRIITNHPEIKFIFWGTYDEKGSNLGKAFEDKEVDDFIRFLKNADNVALRGVVDSETLQQEMMKVDMLWVCWNLQLSSFWNGGNPHKLLEYLSTGKPIASHYVSSYKEYDLLYMLRTKENTGYESLFSDVVNKVKIGEPKALIEKRIIFAINNSYPTQLRFIEDTINSLKSN